MNWFNLILSLFFGFMLFCSGVTYQKDRDIRPNAPFDVILYIIILALTIWSASQI